MRQYIGEKISRGLVNGISNKINPISTSTSSFSSFQRSPTSNFSQQSTIEKLSPYSSLNNLSNIFGNVFSGFSIRGFSTKKQNTIIFNQNNGNRSLNFFQQQNSSLFSFGSISNLISNTTTKQLFSFSPKRYFAKRIKFGQEIDPNGVTLWQDQSTRGRWMMLSTFFSASLLFSCTSWAYTMFTMPASATELAPKKQRYGLGGTIFGLGVLFCGFFFWWRRTAVGKIVLFPNNKVQMFVYKWNGKEKPIDLTVDQFIPTIKKMNFIPGSSARDIRLKGRRFWWTLNTGGTTYYPKALESVLKGQKVIAL